MLKKIRRHSTVSALFLDALLIVNIHVEIGAMLFGESNSFVVNHGRVLHGCNACANRILNSFRGVRVRGNPQAEVAGLVHRRLKLLGRKLLRFWVASVSQDCAAR